MKKILVVFIPVVLLLSVALLISSHEFEKKESRVHQHLEEEELPVIVIETNGKEPAYSQAEVKEDVYLRESEFVDCTFSIYDQTFFNKQQMNAPKDKSSARFKLRGNSSILFDKPPYKVKLMHKDGTENKDMSVLGMPAHDEWILNGPFLDKTLIRNYLCMNIAGEIMPFTPEVRFCELIINGKYRGIYLAMESIEWGEERVPISKYKKGDPFTSYIVRSDRDVSQPNMLDEFTKYSARRPKGTALEVIYPPAGKLTPELKEYIEEDLSRFEKSLYSLDYKDKTYGSERFIDTNSFVDYFIINEFFLNTDAGILSTYFHKDIRGKLQAGPVWDFNNACDNYIDSVNRENGFHFPSYPIFEMLLMDPDFTEAVIARYRTLREGVLSEQYLMDYIDNTISWLGTSIEKNYKVWGYTFSPEDLGEYNKLSPDSRNPKNYEQAVKQLKQCIIQRGNWLDQYIEILRQYSHESKTKRYNK